MKNITKYLVAGMIGAGSLGIFGNNGYGQNDFDNKIILKKVCVLDENEDKKIDKITLWFEYSPLVSLDYSELLSLSYFDEDFNGEMDSYNLQIHKPNKTLKRDEDKIINDKKNIPKHKNLLSAFKFFPLGDYCLNKEGVCNKPNLLDCLYELK